MDMNDEARQWIYRYIDAYHIVTRRINAKIRESIDEGLTSEQFQILRMIDGSPAAPLRICRKFLVWAKAPLPQSSTGWRKRASSSGPGTRTTDVWFT